jgi:quinol monooxygenase YgiN
MSSVVTVVAKLRAAPGKADRLQDLLIEQAAVVRRAEPGCLAYRVHRGTKARDLFLFYETYVDDAAFEVHKQAPHLAEYRKRRESEGLVAGAAEVEIFRAITD